MSDCTEHVEREGSETNSHTAQIVQASSNSTGTQVQPGSGTTTVVDSNSSTRTPETSDCYEQLRACESQAPMALQDSISDTHREIHDDGFDSTPSMRTVTSTCITQTPAQALQCELSDVLTGQDEDVPDETGTIPDSSENKEGSDNGKSIKNTISAATSTFSPHVLRQQMSNLSATMSDGLSQIDSSAFSSFVANASGLANHLPDKATIKSRLLAVQKVTARLPKMTYDTIASTFASLTDEEKQALTEESLLLQRLRLLNEHEEAVLRAQLRDVCLDKRALISRVSKMEDAQRYLSKRAWFAFILGAVGMFLLAYQTDWLPVGRVYEATQKSVAGTSFGRFVNDTYSAVLPEVLGASDGKLGKMMKQEGYAWVHPVVLLPGFVSTSLEVWEAHPECQSYTPVGARIWGAMNLAQMLQHLRISPKCWIKHMQLDPTTGLDPEHIRVRSLEGLYGAATKGQAYWVWNPIVENLIAVGYDTSNMYVATSDWRLSFSNLEYRDGMMTKMKNAIELFVKRYQQKVVVISHSMGSQLFVFFLKWVESPAGGDGGPDWVAKHIHANVNIAGAMLGLPKAAASMASGEFLDTSLLGRISDIVDMTPFSRLQRVNTYKTWGSLFYLLPKGGNALWGDSDAPAPDDYSYTDACGGFMLGSTTLLTTDKTHSGEGLPPRVMPNVTVDEMITEFLPTQFPSMQHHLSNLSFGYSVTPTDNNDAVFKWANPLEVALPNAPEMTMYSIYGEGSYTERSYAYQARDYDEGSEDLKYHINFTKSSGRWTAGVCLTTRGDGTVPLTSLGYMSATQWRKPSHNPHGVKIVTVELPHKPHTLYLRGGDYSCGHVDIMGNRDVNRKVLNIVSGGVEQEAFTSSIREIGDVIYDRLQKFVANRAVPNESEKLRKKAQADERDHARAEHIELKTNDIREDL